MTSSMMSHWWVICHPKALYLKLWTSDFLTIWLRGGAIEEFEKNSQKSRHQVDESSHFLIDCYWHFTNYDITYHESYLWIHPGIVASLLNQRIKQESVDFRSLHESRICDNGPILSNNKWWLSNELSQRPCLRIFDFREIAREASKCEGAS